MIFLLVGRVAGAVHEFRKHWLHVCLFLIADHGGWIFSQCNACTSFVVDLINHKYIIL